MKVASVVAASLLLCMLLPAPIQANFEKPKYCVGRDGKHYLRGEHYDYKDKDKETCIRFTCVRKGQKLKMSKKKIPCVVLPPNLTANVTALEASVKSLQSSVESLHTSMESILEMVTALQFRSSQLETNVTTNKDTININKDDISTNVASLTTKCDASTCTSLQTTAKDIESCLADITSSACPSPPSGKTSMAGRIFGNTAALADKCDASTCSDIKTTVENLETNVTTNKDTININKDDISTNVASLATKCDSSSCTSLQTSATDIESCLADITSSACPSPPSGKTSVAGGISGNTAALDNKCDASTCSGIQTIVESLEGCCPTSSTPTLPPTTTTPIGIVGQWSSWSSCTATCGNATKTRTRTCRIAPCQPFDKEETVKCHLPICGDNTFEERCFFEDTHITFHDFGQNRHNQNQKPEWILSDQGRTLKSFFNTRPSAGLTNLGTISNPVSFSGRVFSTANDDDVMGMVFGYWNETNFFVVASSREDGPTNWYVGRLHATCGQSCATEKTISNAIWSPHDHPEDITVLANASTAWQHNEKYNFTICFNPSKLLLNVNVTLEDGVDPILQTGTISAKTNVSEVDDISRQGGFIGVYVDSQADTTWDNLDCHECGLDEFGTTGWTIIQRRGQFGNAEDYFYKDFNDYENGFGSVDGELWIGLKNLADLTKDGEWELQVDLTDWDDTKWHAKYETFSVGPAPNYTLHVGGFDDWESTLGDSMAFHNGAVFSARDKDQDGSGCPASYKGGWWYSNCFHTNLNGINFAQQKTEWEGIHWRHEKSGIDIYRKTRKGSVMKIRRVKATTTTTTMTNTTGSVFFIAGGYGTDYHDIELYHPTIEDLNCSTTPPPLNSEWVYHTSFYYDNSIYLCGGDRTTRSICISYSSEMSDWKTHTISSSRMYRQSSVVLRNTLYLIGGKDSSYNYNADSASTPLPLTDTPVLTTVPNLSYKGDRQCATQVDQDNLVITGGVYGGILSTVTQYNINTNTETVLPSLQQPRYAHACIVVQRDNKNWIIVAGGSGPLNTTEIIGWGGSSWAYLGDLNVPRVGPAMVETEIGVMVIAGWNSGQSLSSVEVLDWARKEWSVTQPSINTARQYFGTAVEIPASMFNCVLEQQPLSRRGQGPSKGPILPEQTDSKLEFQLKGETGMERVKISVDDNEEEFILKEEWEDFSYSLASIGSFSVEFLNDIGNGSSDVFIRGHESQVTDLLPNFSANTFLGCGTTNEDEECGLIRGGTLMGKYGKYTYTLKG